MSRVDSGEDIEEHWVGHVVIVGGRKCPRQRSSHSGAPIYHCPVGTWTQGFEMSPVLTCWQLKQSSKTLLIGSAQTLGLFPTQLWDLLLTTPEAACHHQCLTAWEILKVHISGNEDLILF